MSWLSSIGDSITKTGKGLITDADNLISGTTGNKYVDKATDWASDAALTGMTSTWGSLGLGDNFNQYYRSSEGKSFAPYLHGAQKIGGQIAATAFGGPMAGMAVGGVQNLIGGMGSTNNANNYNQVGTSPQYAQQNIDPFSGYNQNFTPDYQTNAPAQQSNNKNIRNNTSFKDGGKMTKEEKKKYKDLINLNNSKEVKDSINKLSPIVDSPINTTGKRLEDYIKEETMRYGGNMAIATNHYSNKPLEAPYINSPIPTEVSGYSPADSYNSYRYPKYANGGGLSHFNGPTHEEGGITLGQDQPFAEVEGGETKGMDNTEAEDYIYSDNLKLPGTTQTFAKKSKTIDKKYSLRPWDKITTDAKESELNDLKDVQELVKQHKELSDNLKQYKNGGSIHINPANKGKFNATKERTGKTTEELTHSSNPLTKKRAIFAQNAAHWKHEDGGDLTQHPYYENGGDLPMFIDGGNPTDSILNAAYSRFKNDAKSNEELLNYARLFKYNNSLNSALEDKSKEKYKDLNDSISSKKSYLDKVAYAKEYSSKNPDITLTTDEQKKLLGKNYDDYNKLRSYRSDLYDQRTGDTLQLANSNYGPINKVLTPGTTYQRTYVPSKNTTADFYADADYDPTTQKYSFNYRSPQLEKKEFGGNLPKYGAGDYLQYVPAISNLIGAGVGVSRSGHTENINPDYINPSYIQAPTTNPYLNNYQDVNLQQIGFNKRDNSKQMEAINSAYRGAEQTAQYGTDSGSYQNRMAAYAAAKADARSKAMENFGNDEALRKQQVDTQNAGIANQGTMYNASNRLQGNSQYANLLSQYGLANMSAANSANAMNANMSMQAKAHNAQANQAGYEDTTNAYMNMFSTLGKDAGSLYNSQQQQNNYNKYLQNMQNIYGRDYQTGNKYNTTA